MDAFFARHCHSCKSAKAAYRDDVVSIKRSKASGGVSLAKADKLSLSFHGFHGFSGGKISERYFVNTGLEVAVGPRRG